MIAYHSPVERKVKASPRGWLSLLASLGSLGLACFLTVLAARACAGPDPTEKDAELRKAVEHFRELNIVIDRRKSLVRKTISDEADEIRDAVKNEDWRQAYEQLEFAKAWAEGGRIRMLVPGWKAICRSGARGAVRQVSSGRDGEAPVLERASLSPRWGLDELRKLPRHNVSLRVRGLEEAA